MRRVVVIGASGAGKSTLARRLSEVTGLPHVELDALFWGEGWKPVPRELFRERVAARLAEPAWIMDGNYSSTRDLAWPAADTAVWLDYGLPVTWLRALRRTLWRAVTGAELWAGNRESWKKAFLSRESILLWSYQSWQRYRVHYPELLALPEHRHLRVVRLRNPREAARWLAAQAPRG